MARVPYRDLTGIAPAHQKTLLARKANIYRALANSPSGLDAFCTTASFIRYDSKLDMRLRELAILQVGYTTRQPYEWSHHIEIARRFGVSDDDIRGLMAESEGRPSKLDPLAKNVLKAAREMTEGIEMSDATYQALKADLDDERIVDLAISVGFYNAVVRVLGGLQIDVEPDYEGFLKEFPLPAGSQGKRA